jgi:hypothetical protein
MFSCIGGSDASTSNQTDDAKNAKSPSRTVEDMQAQQDLYKKLISEEYSQTRVGEQADSDRLLISGVNSPAIEAELARRLDTCCDALQSTERLQDKALRAVFSVGIDCAIVDAKTSAMMGRLELRQGDIINHKQTGGIFGKFNVN